MSTLTVLALVSVALVGGYVAGYTGGLLWQDLSAWRRRRGGR